MTPSHVQPLNYALVTPAYNEEKYIGQTIESVLTQRVKPLLWVIVDDGSKDHTGDVIRNYTADHSWIKLLHRQKEPGQSYYASNVYAIQLGMDYLLTQQPDCIGILDADITLPEDYYEKILGALATDPKLGVTSGNCADLIDGELKRHLYDRRSCAKAIIVFRRECYESIGGFVPMKYGGEDTCACFTARMKGWKTWAFHEWMVIHNKPLGTGPSSNMLKIRFRQGICDWALAAPWPFMLLKCIRRCIKESPRPWGGMARWAGYICAHFLGEKRQISMDLVKFIRKEQLGRVFTGNKIQEESRVDISL